MRCLVVKFGIFLCGDHIFRSFFFLLYPSTLSLDFEHLFGFFPLPIQKHWEDVTDLCLPVFTGIIELHRGLPTQRVRFSQIKFMTFFHMWHLIPFKYFPMLLGHWRRNCKYFIHTAVIPFKIWKNWWNSVILQLILLSGCLFNCSVVQFAGPVHCPKARFVWYCVPFHKGVLCVVWENWAGTIKNQGWQLS